MNDSLIIASVSTVSTLLGITIGALLNYFLEKNRRKEELFFEARKSAYSNFVGVARNIITEGFSESDVRKFNSVASESLLMSRDLLRKRLIEFCNLKSKIRSKMFGGKFDDPSSK